MSVDRLNNPDLLSDFFEGVRLKGQFFYAGAVEGVLDLKKPPGMAFIYILESGDMDLVRPRAPVVHLREPSVLLCPSSCRYKLRSVTGECPRIVVITDTYGDSVNPQLSVGATVEFFADVH